MTLSFHPRMRQLTDHEAATADPRIEPVHAPIDPPDVASRCAARIGVRVRQSEQRERMRGEKP